MNVTELLSLKNSELFTITIIGTILSMMLTMALRLYISRKTQPFLILALAVTVSFILTMSGYYLSTGQHQLLLKYHYVIVAGNVLALIFTQYAFYLLYNPSRSKNHRVFFFSLIGAAAIAIIHVLTKGVLYQGKDMLLQLYAFLVVVYFYFWIPDQVGQKKKYKYTLFLFAVSLGSNFLNQFILKSPKALWMNLYLFLPIVSYFLMFIILFERVVELLQSITKSSVTDPLTELFNRRYFSLKVKQHIERGILISVIFSDIDNFKKLNDTQGHEMGDKMLKAVAKIMKEECEEIGIAGRYGGEEIVVLVTDPSIKVDKLAETIRLRIQTETIVTTSIGYSQITKDVTADELIKQADKAMYIAKQAGKNRVVSFSPSIDE
ncbi:MAG: diguanylate cyclase [Bacilli bacterium]|nr:diguanylate cyclase [Bacilli bacterium]